VAPMLDAAISQPRDAGQDAGMPPPMMDAAGPPQDAAPGGTLPAPEAAVLAGQTCTTTPAYPTPDACSKCICSECASQVAICYASDEPAKNQLCKQVRDCAQANHCTGDRCYCDDSFPRALARRSSRPPLARATSARLQMTPRIRSDGRTKLVCAKWRTARPNASCKQPSIDASRSLNPCCATVHRVPRVNIRRAPHL
jgi:hypothetical protein